ncbi:MAG: monothiol bacilliredoxin BrxC family protein [Planctomycetota bacterium]
MGGIRELDGQSLPENCYVFKHSTRCPVSSRAAERVKGENWELPLLWVNVIERRDLSDWIAQSLDVKHESPQLIKLEGGSVVKVWTHSRITDATDIP